MREQLHGTTLVPGVDTLDPSHGRLFVVIGVFDGLHRGHIYLLRHLVAEARARGARPAVITFDHHPDEVLTGAAPPLLCDPEERLARLAAAGVEVTVVQHFDVALRMTEYDAFVRRIAARVDLAGFLMTPDSAFGHDRRGTPAAVSGLGRELAYEVVVVPSLELDGRPVRSTEIRTAIAEGDLAHAAHLLGRSYALVGTASTVTPSGAQMTFPMPVALPPAGSYGVRVVGAGSGPGFESTAAIDDGGRVTVPGLPHDAGQLRVEFD